MPETETVGMTELSPGHLLASQEMESSIDILPGQIEASVGQTEVVALVETGNSENSCETIQGEETIADVIDYAPDVDVPKETNAESNVDECSETLVEEVVQAPDVNNSNNVNPESMNNVEESEFVPIENETVILEQTHTVDDSPIQSDNFYVIDNDNKIEVEELNIPNDNSEPVTVNEEPVNISNEASDIEALASEVVSDPDNQNLTTQTIMETESTQSVFQSPESLPEAQIEISAQDTTNPSIQTFTLSEPMLTAPEPSNVLKSVVESTINDMMPLSETTKVHHQHHNLQTHIKIEGLSEPQGISHMAKPPKTDLLLQTAREVLQLPEEQCDVKNFIIGPGGQILEGRGGQIMEGGELNHLSLNVMPVSETVISATDSIMNSGQAVTTVADHRISIEDENVQQMEVCDENATYILEPVTNEEFYNDDPNIMWIQETVEVEQESYDNLPNMVIILNPNGTINEELMLAHGMNLETIKAVTENAITTDIATHTTDSPIPPISIKSLQHPIPRKDLTDVKPLMTSQVPRTVMESVLTDAKPYMQPPRTIIESATPVTEHSRSVILDPKDNFLVLGDELDRDPMIEPMDLPVSQATHRIININGVNHIVTNTRTIPDLRRTNFFPSQLSPNLNIQKPHDVQFQVSNLMHNGLSNSLPMTPLGTLDLSLPKKPDPTVLEQYVNPNALVSENSVLKALSKPEFGHLLAKDQLAGKIIRTNGQKVRRPKARDENGNGAPYIHRKTTSLGALGQALHGTLLGIPRDSRENAVQICPICKFQATTKNPYRHLQDHLARMHFKERIAVDLPTKKPYICPMPGCDGKHYPDWQAVMRHYIGKKHGILDKFVKEELAQIRRENGGRIPGTMIKPGIEIQL